MDRDIIGTFYNYTMKIYPKTDDLASYDAFYNIISDPNYASHEMTFPYGQETLTFQAYVSQGKDKLRIRNGKNIWGMDGLSLNFTATEEAVSNEMGHKGRDQWAAAVLLRG